MKRFLKTALLGSVLAFGLVSGASAADTSSWREVGPWSVRVDATMGNGCYIVASYASNTLVRVGLDARDRKGYIAIYADGLEAGKTYSVRFLFDGQDYTTSAKAYADTEANRVFLAHWNISADAIGDFGQRNTLKVVIDGRTLAFVTLRGTYAALMEMFECQKAQNATQSSRTSPPPSGNSTGPWTVPISRNGSLITLKARLNDGAATTFMLDTGATVVSIPQDMADRMGLKPIRYEDVRYGDGSVGREAVVVISKVALVTADGGTVYLNNVEAMVGKVGAPLLIGKNFLDKFSSYQIDNRAAQLVLKQ